MKDTFSALVVFSSSILLSIPNSQSYETREPLPQTGYWNYLPILGLWGRVAHHFLTDTDGIGTEVKILDKMFKEEYGAEEFVTLERDIVNKLPKSDVIYHLLEIMQNLQDIRDPITGKTLGDAFNIMINLQNDSKAVKEYTKRLNLVEPDHVTFYSSDTSDFNVLKVLKNAILQNPLVIIEILEDSQIDSTIANSVLTYLSSDKFLHGIDNMRTLLETFIVLYSDVLREENHPILAIKDPDTKMSLSEILKALLKVVSSEEFIQEIKTIVTSRELLDHLHENTKEIISTAIQQNKPYLMTPRNFIKKLKPFHIEVTEEDAEFLIEASKDGDLGAKAAQFLDQLKRVPDLDAKKISEIIADKGVKLSPDMIVNAMDSLVHYPPAMVSAILKDLGLSIPTPQLKVLVKTVKEMKEKYDAEDNDNSPTEKEDDESSLNDDNDQDVVSSSASELPKYDSAERVNNVTPLSYSV